jgi:hypothetical protein
MIDSEGEIIDHELHSPFAYLRSLVDEFSTENPQECGSEQPLGGAPTRGHWFCSYGDMRVEILDTDPKTVNQDGAGSTFSQRITSVRLSLDICLYGRMYAEKQSHIHI